MFNLKYLDSFGTPCAVPVDMVADVEYEVGLPLTATGAIAKGTAKPEYICLEKTKGIAGEQVAAFRILPQHTFETVLSVADAESTLKVGDKVQLADGGNGVTINKSSGVAEIVRIDGRAIGDTVLVKF